MGRKPNLLRRVAGLGLRASRRCMARYSHPKSPQIFTQAQLMAMLILKTYLRTTYRGVIEQLELMPAVREALGLTRLPHYTTLQKFAAREEIPAMIDAMLAWIVREVGPSPQRDAAMDSTGLETTGASAHFVSRAGRRRSKFVKVSMVVLCGVMIPAALVVDWGPSHDMKQAWTLLEKARGVFTPSFLWGDRAFDSDALHAYCWLDWGVSSYAPAREMSADGRVGGFFRPFMRIPVREYGRRWHQESLHSAMKRTVGSTLAARTERTMFNEASLKALTYAIRR